MSGQIKDVKIDIGEDAVKISAADPDLGENLYTIPSKNTGKNVSMYFNHQYLRDGVGVFDCDEVVFSLNNESSPGLFKSSDNSGHIHLIMPIKGR